MPSILEQLTTKQFITPPSWMAGNVMFETVMGSVAFGVSDDLSDMDMLGFCMPPKDIVFPHLGGEIIGFGRQKRRFTCYQKHHIKVNEGGKVRVYDLNMYNIVHYFHLCMENNPNMLASLFTPWDCVMHSTKVAQMVREKRHRFLHKGAWHRFKGYAYNQLNKMRTKTPSPDSKRYETIQKHGYDVKFAYHVVRLLDEVEQILTLGDLDIRRNRAQLKAIRRGEFTAEEIYKWASEKEQHLERAYERSMIPDRPNEDYIKKLLLNCLEEHWGSLERFVALDKLPVVALREIAEIIDRNRNLLGV